LPELKKAYSTENLAEIDSQLREEGLSLAAMQRQFIDQMFGQLYVRSKVKRNPDVSLAEIVQHYHEHQDRYRHQAQARWEQLTVLFENFSSREAARKAIWEMLQEARFGGSMQAVARAKSQEPFADSGGVHGWTNRGSLASNVLDDTIFNLPLNRISDVIEDENGFHVVRVLERKPAGITPLSEIQDEIRKEIRQSKVAQSRERLTQEIQDRVPVWSLFPDDIPGAKPLPESTRTARRSSRPRRRSFARP
jgi:hypothetical protein